MTEVRMPASAVDECREHYTATQFGYVLEVAAQMQTVEGVVEHATRRGVGIPSGLAYPFFNP